MKKNINTLLTAILFTIAAANAQKASVGFSAGITLSSYKTKVDNDASTSDTRVGFTAGIMSDIPMGKSLSFQPAVYFTQKGGSEKEASIDYKLTTSLNYVEVPLNIVFKAPSQTGNFFIGAGPSVAFGLSGKFKGEFGDEKAEMDVKFGSEDNDDLKALDMGINVLGGYQAKGGFTFAVNYNHGLSNLMIDGNSDNYFRNNYFGLRLGYFLPHKKK